MRSILRVVGKRRKSKRHGIILRFSVFFLIWSITFAIFEYFVPLYLDSLAINYFMIGLIISGASVCSFFIDPILGYFQQKYSPRILLIAASLMFCLNVIFFIKSGNIIFLLFLAYCVYGIAYDLFSITVFKVIFDNSIESDRSTNISYLDVVNHVGLLVGAIIAGFVVSSNLHNAAYISIAMIIALAIIVYWIKRDKTKQKPSKISFSEGHKEILYELKHIGGAGIFLIFLMVFLHLWDGFFFVFEPIFTQKFSSFAVSEEIIGGLLLAVYMLPIVLFESKFGKLEDKRGRKGFIFLGFFIAAIGIFLLQATDSLIVTGLGVFLLAFGFYSVAMPAIEGMYESIAEKRLPEKFRGISASIMSIALSVGFFIGPLVGGIFISTPGGFNEAFRIFSFLTFLILVFSVIILKDKKSSWQEFLLSWKLQKQRVVYAKAIKRRKR